MTRRTSPDCEAVVGEKPSGSAGAVKPPQGNRIALRGRLGGLGGLQEKRFARKVGSRGSCGSRFANEMPRLIANGLVRGHPECSKLYVKQIQQYYSEAGSVRGQHIQAGRATASD